MLLAVVGSLLVFVSASESESESSELELLDPLESLSLELDDALSPDLLLLWAFEDCCFFLDLTFFGSVPKVLLTSSSLLT